MAASSTRSRSGNSADFRRSISPSGRFCFSQAARSSASAFASSSASSFSTRSSAFFQRSASPTRVSLSGSASPPPSVRFSIDRSTSPGRSLAFASPRDHHHNQHHHHHKVVKKPIGTATGGAGSGSGSGSGQRKTCLCSPTTHPGSFRCSLHKGFQVHHHQPVSNRLNARRSAMTNSLVRIGTVEGEWVKRSLTSLVRPSSHQQRRRAAFQPGPSRLSVMSKAGDDDGSL